MGRNHAGGDMEAAKGWNPCAAELLGRQDLDLWVDESSLGIGTPRFYRPWSPSGRLGKGRERSSASWPPPSFQKILDLGSS